MAVFFEIIGVMLQTMWAFLSGIATALWENLPTILEIKKVLGYFSPAGIVALSLGVPTIVITVAVFIIKKVAKA